MNCIARNKAAWNLEHSMGQTGWDRQDGTDRMGQIGWDRQDGTDRMGQIGWDRQTEWDR